MYFSNMVESYLLQGLILECVLFSTHDKMDRFINELEDELSNTKEALAQKQELLKTITEEIDEPECLQEKLKEAQKKAYEDANEAGEKLDQKKNKLKDSKKSLKEAILSQRGQRMICHSENIKWLRPLTSILNGIRNKWPSSTLTRISTNLIYSKMIKYCHLLDEEDEMFIP